MLLRARSLVLLGIFLGCACYFATFGTGNYTYEASVGDVPDSLNAKNEPELPPDSLDETLEDDFDLLDENPDEP